MATRGALDLLDFEVSAAAVLWAGIALASLLAVAAIVLQRRSVRARHGLRYLSAGQFRTLSALAESLLGSEPGSPRPEEVAANADRYLARFEARRKWLMKAAVSGIGLYPVLFGRLPLSLMDVGKRRRFLEVRFRGDVARRRIGGLRRWLVQAAIRVGQQLAYLGYYSDPRSHNSVGYVPFSRRERYPDPPPDRGRERPLEVIRPDDIEGPEISSEIVIVGSGAAGALIGYRLAERGHRVLILERGRHVDPSEFTEDEAEMLTRLYGDGAVQLTRDFRLQVLQGMCVGGTTVVNNAVCVDPPAGVLDSWSRNGVGDGLSPELVQHAARRVRELLGITSQPTEVAQPGARKFVDGVSALGLDRRAAQWGPVDANISGCLGCGYCNIGCAYGRKLSVLDTLLPWAQERFGSDRLRIVSGCEAEGIEEDRGRAIAVSCRCDGRRLRVCGKTIVVAAGAINSSWLLRRSRLGGRRAGEGLSFNVGSPMTADFEEELRSHDGLQISHLLQPEAGEFVIETWWNPVLSQALAMPGWFEQHRENMRRYAHMTAAGVLVGSESTGRVQRALLGGADIAFELSRQDLATLLAGLKLTGRIYLAAGARRVMPATFSYHEFRSEAELERLDDLVTDNSDIQLGTGHPQGGNALAIEPDAGVVDPRSFEVHGTAGLHLCDASVFPTSITVNPQLTVMSLAELAAERIAARLKGAPAG